MRLFTRLTVAAVGIALALSGCSQDSSNAEVFSVTHPDGLLRQHLVTAYAFLPERRAPLTEAYETAAWKVVDAMTSGKLPYKYEGLGKVDEEGKYVEPDLETGDIPHLPVTPNGWVWIHTTPNLQGNLAWAEAIVKLKDGQVDRSVLPDQFQVVYNLMDGDTWKGGVDIEMLGPSMHFGNDMRSIPDTWTTLLGSVPNDEEYGVSIQEANWHLTGKIASDRQFQDVMSQLKVTVGDNDSPTIDDVKAADARFIQTLSRLHLDGSDVVQ